MADETPTIILEDMKASFWAKVPDCEAGTRGHPLSGDNVRIQIRADGVRRRCRACSREHGRQRRGKKILRIAE